jgi:hypothetical protein
VLIGLHRLGGGPPTLGEGRYCEELEARPERWVNGVLFNEYPYVGVRA